MYLIQSCSSQIRSHFPFGKMFCHSAKNVSAVFYTPNTAHLLEQKPSIWLGPCGMLETFYFSLAKKLVRGISLNRRWRLNFGCHSLIQGQRKLQVPNEQCYSNGLWNTLESLASHLKNMVIWCNRISCSYGRTQSGQWIWCEFEKDTTRIGWTNGCVHLCLVWKLRTLELLQQQMTMSTWVTI